MRAFVLAIILGASVAVAPAAATARPGAAPSAVSATTGTAPAEPAPGPTDAERYGEREQQSTQLEGFDGGRRVIIGISTGALLLIVLLVLLLA